MKPKSIRRFLGVQSIPSLALVTAFTAFSSGSLFATDYNWNLSPAAPTGNWQTSSNWPSGTIAPFNTTGTHRLNVNSATTLVYSAAEGTTVYANTTGSNRGLVIGNSAVGSMTITGGSFSSVGSNTEDVIGHGSGNATLTIAGGEYIGAAIGTSMGLSAGPASKLNIQSGSATVATLKLNNTTGIINLDGGTLAANNFTWGSGNNTINLNGGTLKARTTSTTFLPNLSSTNVYVKSAGAIIDTDGFDVTIGEALLTDSVSTGGGITKNGSGTLTLGAVSTTTGAAIIHAGGLGVAAGSTSWQPSSLTHAGEKLNFDLGIYNASNPAPINTPSLVLDTADIVVDISGSSLPISGQITLLDYGTKTGAGSISVTPGSLPPGVDATIEENTIDGYYYLNILPPSGTELTWSVGTGDWDDLTSNWNWNLNSIAYSEPALVTFPDLSGGGTVNLTANWSPTTFEINNNLGNDYTFSGPGALIGGASLIKNGTGAAIFSAPVSFAGDTNINEGRIELAGTTPLASSIITIASGAVLSYNNSANTTQGAPTATGLNLVGAGTLEKKGTSTVTFANGTGPVNWNLGSGALIDIQQGTLKGGSNTNDIWTNNKADLNIASGAVFEGVEANVTVDALTGGGTYQAGYFGPRDLKIGVDHGSGTFSGSIQSNGGNAANSVILIKVGSGEQTLDGSINIFNYYTGTILRVNGGTLNISPTAPSVIGSTGSDVSISPGQTDVSTVNQTAGTITTRSLSIGQQGAADYNISGGIINAAKIELALTGPTTGSGAVAMNVSDSAEVNLNSNGIILMGQYYGRPVTVTQTGGNVTCFSDAGVTRGGTGGLAFRSGSTVPAYNLEGGTLSIPAIVWSAAGGGFGGGNGTLNFSGGILQITSAAFAVPTGLATNGQPKIVGKVLGDHTTPDSGAIIDPYGLGVTFAAPILHGPVGIFDGGLKISSSVTGGSLTLSGVNTYTGNTTIPAGNTLVLANGAALTFVLDGTEHNKITGAGNVTLNGSFIIDTSLAAPTNAQTWTLVDVSTLTESYDSSFTINGFTEAGTSGVHTMTDISSNVWTFTESTGVLSVSIPTAGGYSSWIDDFTVADPAEGADPDNDGIKNLLEFVLNGNPSISDPASLPDLVVTATDYEFTFTRRDDSLSPETTQTFEYGTDLTNWTSIVVPATSGSVPPATVTVIDGTPADTVTVKIPKTEAGVTGTLFGRLKVTKP